MLRYINVAYVWECIISMCEYNYVYIDASWPHMTRVLMVELHQYVKSVGMSVNI